MTSREYRSALLDLAVLALCGAVVAATLVLIDVTLTIGL